MLQTSGSNHLGPINWLAVLAAAALAMILWLIGHSLLFPVRRGLLAPPPIGLASRLPLPILVFLIGAAMLGHNFARLGAETLAVKPWLYWMQSGGFALTFIAPAVLLTYQGGDTLYGRRVGDALLWIVVFLAMGTVFWALG